MAARDGRGGLSPAAPDAADILDAFGMDRVFIETLGVGQAELDIMACADILVLVLQPGTGDSIQILKAGIIETADLIVVNKTDMPGADNLLEALRFLFEAAGGGGNRSTPPLCTAAAAEDRGLDDVWTALESLVVRYRESGRLREKRRFRLENEIRAAISGSLWERYLELAGGTAEIAAAAERLVREGASPYPFIRGERRRINLTLDASGTPLPKAKD
jgi:LAO/AO transport system kinase